jgi:hypothetical protein
MRHGIRKASATFGAVALAAASLAAAPAAAQAGSGTEDPADPNYCYSIKKYPYLCCNRYDVCTQIFLDSPIPPEGPAEPTESPEQPKQ